MTLAINFFNHGSRLALTIEGEKADHSLLFVHFLLMLIYCQRFRPGAPSVSFDQLKQIQEKIGAARLQGKTVERLCGVFRRLGILDFVLVDKPNASMSAGPWQLSKAAIDWTVQIEASPVTAEAAARLLFKEVKRIDESGAEQNYFSLVRGLIEADENFDSGNLMKANGCYQGMPEAQNRIMRAHMCLREIKTLRRMERWSDLERAIVRAYQICDQINDPIEALIRTQLKIVEVWRLYEVHEDLMRSIREAENLLRDSLVQSNPKLAAELHNILSLIWRRRAQRTEHEQRAEAVFAFISHSDRAICSSLGTREMALQQNIIANRATLISSAFWLGEHTARRCQSTGVEALEWILLAHKIDQRWQVGFDTFLDEIYTLGICADHQLSILDLRKNQRLSNSLLDVCFSDETDLLSYAGGVLNRWLENRNTRVAYEAIAFQDGLLLIEVAWRAIIERDVALRLRALGWLSRALDHAASDKRLPYLHQLNATLRALAKYGRLLEGFEAAMRRGMWRIRGMTLLGRALLHAPSKQRQVDVEALCELLANAN